MARGRFLSKSLSVSKKFNQKLPGISGKRLEFHQLLYTMLVPHTDDYGRMQGDPWTVRSLVLPHSKRTEKEYGDALKSLHDSGLISWYTVDEDLFIEITDFDEHQMGLHKRTSPKIPGPSGNVPEIPGQGKGSEGKGSEEKVSTPLPPKEEKVNYAEAVTMTEKQYQSLVEDWGGGQVATMVKILNDYKMSSGKPYKSDFHAMHSWVIDKCLERNLIRQIKMAPKKAAKPKLCEVCKENPPYMPAASRCMDCIEIYGDTGDVPDAS